MSALALSFDRDRRLELMRHALMVSAFNAVIGLGLWLVKGGALDEQLVYSFAIGTSIWLLCDFGRFVLGADPVTRWPRGGRMVLLWVVAIGGGYAIGLAIGHRYAGHWVYFASIDSPRRLVGFIITGLAISIGVTFFFYAQGRAIAQRRLLEEAHRTTTETRLKLLEAQLQPHMLFNTLANLRVLIGLDPARAQAMLDDLNAFLRATLSASRATLHPLSAEFERLRSYLALMQVRMGERLQYELLLPDTLAGVLVPPSLLQPLVENAIQHGLEPHIGTGRITVRAEPAAHGGVHLSVRDTGIGLPTGALAGVGLSLVRERLATVYGPTATLTLQPSSDTGGGTLAQLDLPCLPTALQPP